jgi:hypothetical protein
MNQPLDPWTQARELAERLHSPDARLVIVLGAEGWCEKCRRFRPLFDARAQQAEPEETWLWLDMEEHAEFIDPYLPDDLPLLILYRSGQLVGLQVLEAKLEALQAALAADADQSIATDPGIFERLARNDWAR